MSVLDLFVGNSGIFRIMDFGVSPLQSRMFEDAHFEIGSLSPRVFDAIKQVAGHFRDAPAKNRVIEILDQWKAPGIGWASINDQLGARWERSGETRQHDQ